MKIGAQMYTVRASCKTEEGLLESLKKIAEMGYDSIHLSGCCAIDPHLLRKTCDELGVKIALTHNPVERIINDTDALIKEHDILGCDCIGLGSIPKEYRDDSAKVDEFFKSLEEPIRKIAAAGKRFNYHNHAYEFNMLDGKRLMDRILEYYDASLMGITLDTYWVHQGGADIYQWIEKMAGRLEYVHIKDQILEDDGKTAKMAPIGDGNMNYPAILAALEKAGCKYAYVEQDHCYDQDPFECLERSLKYGKSLGY